MNILKIHCIIYIIIQKERVRDLDNEKDIQNTLNNQEQDGNTPINPQKIFNSNDSIEVNNLINLTNADITPDILEQLEARAREEQQ